jgi:septum formation protein
VVAPADVDEHVFEGERPADYVRRLALAKAAAVADAHPGEIVLAADTVVVVDADILGKPVDDAHARGMLSRLSGRTHEVMTGLCLQRGALVRAAVERTIVTCAPLSTADIADYVASGEPRDKAGAYAIQGRASRFILKIDGSYSNVVGLPVATLCRLLGELQPATRNSDHFRV